MNKSILFMVLCLVGAATNATAYSYSNLIGYNPVESSGKQENDSFVDNIGDMSLDSYDISYYGYLGSDIAGSWSGYYIGTLNGNENKNLSDAIEHYIGTSPTLIEKIDYSDDNSTKFSVTYDSGNKSGTWFTTDQTNDAIEFYTVKGATNWALYFVDPAQVSGFWSTEHLVNAEGSPTISHISATFTTPPDPGPGPGPGPNPVPEPATMLLFGTGLMGIATVGRARKKK